MNENTYTMTKQILGTKWSNTEGDSSGDREFLAPHKGPVTRKMFPFDDVVMPNHRSHAEETMIPPISSILKADTVSKIFMLISETIFYTKISLCPCLR